MLYAHILTRLIDAPLYAHPLKAATLYNALCGRFGTLPMEVEDSAPELSRFVGEWPMSEDQGSGRRARVEPFRLTAQGIGVVTVTGTLVRRGAWVGSHSGLTSYEGIKHQLQRAAADSRVTSIILDLDTPGGEASGAFEAAQAVRSAADKKPVIAVANGMAASAGYALASGATKIITTPSGVAGSIGCVLLHLDYSRAMEEQGIRPTLIVAGAHKTDGNALMPLDDAATATLRDEVTRYYDLFVETVAAGRGRRTPARVARETEGRSYIGREAVDARLVDDVGTFEEVLGDLTRRATRNHNPDASKKVTGSRSFTVDPLLDDELDNQVAAKSIPDKPEPEPGPTKYADRIKLIEDESTIADGEMIQLERFKAIAGDSRVKGKLEFAVKLACQAPDLTADQIGALCEELPTPVGQVERRLSLAERSRETGADNVSSIPVPDHRDKAKQGWEDAIAATNKRTLAEVKKR